MTQLKDGGCQPSNREERSLSASTVIARWQGNGWDEPCKSRGLRTVLWAAGGEIPPADPAAWNPTQERAPLQWAMTQNNLGNTLSILGQLERNTERVEEAIEAYRAALEEYTRERAPLQWR